MTYIDVLWHQQEPDYPVRLVSELDDDRYETRKLEFFGDGRVGFADSEVSREGTELGEAPVPPIAQINVDPQFTARETTAAAFEDLWLRSTAAVSR